MKTFFQVAASIALATALVPAADATPGVQEGTINGYQATIIESVSYDRPDHIGVYGPHGPERITVVCAPYNWNSYGPNSTEFVDSIARAWCF